MSKETFYLPVTYEMRGYIEVEGKSIEDAIEIFNKAKDEGYDFALPKDSKYVDDSFKISSHDLEEIKLMHIWRKNLERRMK